MRCSRAVVIICISVITLCSSCSSVFPGDGEFLLKDAESAGNLNLQDGAFEHTSDAHIYGIGADIIVKG